MDNKSQVRVSKFGALHDTTTRSYCQHLYQNCENFVSMIRVVRPTVGKNNILNSLAVKD